MNTVYVWQTAQGHKYIILYFIIMNLIGIRNNGT